MNRLKYLITHFYDVTDTVCLTSSPRSGSTWVAETLVRAGKYDFVDEPLAMNPTFQGMLRASGIVARTCLADSDEGRVQSVAALMEQALKGRVGWLQVYPGFSRNLLLKFVRLNRMMAFNVDHFGIKKNILLVRHPCAVVASQRAMHNYDSAWSRVTGPAPDVPDSLRSKVEELTNGEQLRVLTLNWCLDQLIPIFIDRPANTILVFYEDLIESPSAEWDRVFEFLGLKSEKPVDKPSRTASVDFSKGSQLSKWKEQLTDMEIEEILWTCNKMGIDFYSEKPTPLHRPW